MNRLFTTASDETLCAMIAHAREKLVIVSPGLSIAVANAIAARIQQNGGPPVLSVILDIDPEVCRLGYGDMESFDILRSALELRRDQIQMQKGVRIGLIVADSEIMVFSPTPRYIEAGSNSNDKPNAIRITENCTTDLPVACGAVTDDKAVAGQEIGLDFANANVLKETKANLEANPPRKFDLVRLERVFNYSLEFVEFSVEHYKLKTRSVQLPPELLGLIEKNLQERIRNSFRVFEAETPFLFKITDPCPLPPPEQESQLELKLAHPRPAKIELCEKWLTDEAARIRKDYLISLGSSAYGNLILKRHKPRFLVEIARLENLVALYAQKVRENIEAKIQNTRDALIKDLFPRIKSSPPRLWLNQSVHGTLSDATIRQRLGEAINNVFQTVETSFTPKVIKVFKGVNYETITTDKHFHEKIVAYFGKDETAKLLSQYDASRAGKRDTE